MRYKLTARSASELLKIASFDGEGTTRYVSSLIEPVQFDIPGPVFAEGPSTMSDSALNYVRKGNAASQDPGLQLFSSRNSVILGDSFVVLDDKWLIFNNFRGEDIRTPAVNYHKSVSLDAKGQIFIEKSDELLDFYSGSYVLIYWQPAKMYHHWVYECLSRCIVASMDSKVSGAKFLIPLNVPKFALDTLQLMGITKDRIVFFDPNRLCQVEELLLIPVPKFDLDVCGGNALKTLRENALKNIPKSPIDNKKVIFSRRDAMTGERILINEDNVISRLEDEGFFSVDLTSYSVGEQISIANNSDVIVCVHGSAGANLLFCSSSTKVLHLFPDCVHYFYAHGIGTALAGAPYAYLYGSSFQRRIRYHNNPWLVSPERVVECVNKLQSLDKVPSALA